MKKLICASGLLLAATQASALTAPGCQLAYTANSFSPTDTPILSNVKHPVAIPLPQGVPGKASTVFISDGVINTITAAAEDDRNGVTKLTVSVDLANGSLNEENTFFVNTFNDYVGQRISSLILRPEGQTRFNFPTPTPVPGQPVPPAQPLAPLTFKGSTDWNAAAITALTGKVINQIEIDCSSDLH